MIYNISKKTWLAATLGVIVGGVTVGMVLGSSAFDGHFHGHDEAEGAYHIHADFLMMVDGTKVDLSADEYKSSAGKILHPGVHLHDNKDAVIHFHAPDITLVEFLSSLDITLSKDCLTIHNDVSCQGSDKVMQLFVNNKDYTDQLETYVPHDDDSILLYYGTPNNPDLSNYRNDVTNDACLYSGTCPERGTPPPEECGLTCEL